MKKLFIFLVITIVGIVSLFSFAKESYAFCTEPPETDIYFCAHQSGTTWGVTGVYHLNSELPHTTYTFTNLYLTSSAYFGSSCGSTSTPASYNQLRFVGYKATSADSVTWHTACIDPTTGITPTFTDACRMGEGEYFTDEINVSCSSNTRYGAPASCDNPNGWGYIAANSWCPSGPYCMKAGVTDATSCRGAFASDPTRASSTTFNAPDSCSGTGGCTRYWCNTVSSIYGPMGNCNSSAYSSACGGNTIAGTSMCSSWSYTCSPPMGTVTATASCNGSSPQISVNWNAPSRSNGSYDLRWREGSGSWTNVCTPSKPYVITSLKNNTSYTVQVRGNTTAGYNGPTNFGSDTVITPTCAPNLSVSGLTIPNGYAGQGGNATVTVTNTGSATPTGFDIGFATDGTTATCATAFSAKVTTAALGANSSRAITVPFTYPSAAGSHTAVAMADASCQVTESSEADNTRTATYTVTANTITTNVYQDLNGNGAQDVGEPAYQGAAVSITGPNNASGTTGLTGQYVFNNLAVGNYAVRLTVPSGYVQTSPKDINNNPINPVSVTLPPPATVNFGIRPPAPVCSGGLTANPTTVNPGQTSTLSANGCTPGGQGGTLTYTWLTPSPGSITSTNPSVTNTATWRAPSPYWTDIYAYPTVNVCQTGTSLCTPYGISNGVGLNNAGIHIIPLFTISGNVFVDQNKDGQQQAGVDQNYTGAISIVPSAGSVTYPAPAGSFLISNLPGGTYTVSYNWPARYVSTNPDTNLRPATFTVTVGNTTTGTPCNTNGVLGATCDNVATPATLGNISVLRYGISNSLPWIQAIGGDITGSSVADPNGGGFSNPIPAGASCGTYTSLVGTVVGGGPTPGLIYSGAGSYDFGSGQASQNPYNWVLGGNVYPEVYTPLTPGVIKTSYAYVSSIARASGITPVNISSYCGAGGLNGCQLPANLPNGIYIANSALTLSGPSYTFPANKNFVILVNGDLNINTEIHVPNGSTATFISANDIIVGATVGEAVATSTRTNIEGYYSADKHFIITGVNSCPTTDPRLNVGGSIVVNAGLNSAASLAQQANFVNGGFVNERDLCSQDLQCPAFSVIERPDFIVNAPDFFKTTRRIWREIAP